MTPEQSPLFTPALWEGSHFKILDETLLPWKVEYLAVTEPCEALRAVKEMKARARRVPAELLESGGAEAILLDSDVTTFWGERVIPEGVVVYPVEKEVIPWSLLKKTWASGL